MKWPGWEKSGYVGCFPEAAWIVDGVNSGRSGLCDGFGYICLGQSRSQTWWCHYTDLYNSNLYSHRLIQSGNRSFSPSPCRPSTTHLRLSYFIHHTFPTTLPQIVPLTCTAGAIYRGQLTYQPAHFGGKHTFTGKTCKLHTDSTKGLNLGRWNHETAVLYLHHCALCVVHL